MATANTANTANTAMKTTPTPAPAPAMRSRKMSRDERDARAIQLADEKHLLYRTRCLGPNGAGWYVFRTPSARDDSVHYVQLVNPMTGESACNCEAGKHTLPCGHLGSALHCWRQIAAAMSEAGQRAHQRYLDFAAFLETRGW